LNGTVAKVVADLGDSNLTPWFGPVLEAIDLEQTTYSALVVYVGVVIDTWSLVVMDLSSMFLAIPLSLCSLSIRSIFCYFSDCLHFFWLIG
jgi:hypothetical protein